MFLTRLSEINMAPRGAWDFTEIIHGAMANDAHSGALFCCALNAVTPLPADVSLAVRFLLQLIPKSCAN